jgi:hypothetical protein
MEFIYKKQNCLSKELCKEFIDKFEKSSISGPGVTSNHKGIDLSEGIKKSTDISFFIEDLSKLHIEEGWDVLLDILSKKLKYNVDNYTDKFDILQDFVHFKPISFNMQKYKPGEGFYEWHAERTSVIEQMPRVLVWMIYLNDVDDGGTEFKYQKHTETAEEGKLLIWPSDWPWTHRGQVSKTKTKYILTGWYEMY